MCVLTFFIYKTGENSQNHTSYRSKKSKKYSIIRQKNAKKYKKILKKPLIIDQKTEKMLNNKAQFERFGKIEAKTQKSGKSHHYRVISISKFEKKIQF